MSGTARERTAVASVPTVASLMPTSEIAQIGWRDCLMWAIGKREIVERFREETGCRWTPGASPLEQMIDKATGVETEFAAQFVQWFNRNIWGALPDGRAVNGDEPDAAPERAGGGEGG